MEQCEFFCLFLFLVFAPPAFSFQAAAVAPKRILLIYETQQATPGHLEMERSIRTTLRNNNLEAPEIYRESLDIGQFPETREQSVQWIRTKYSQRPVDLVIYIGNTASPFFPDVPAIYCGDTVLLEKSIGRKGKRDLIMPLTIDIAGTLERMSRLNPDAKKLLLIAATSDNVGREAILQQVLTFKSDLQFEDASSSSVQQLGQKLAGENEKTLALYVTYSRGPNGEQYLSHDVLASLASVSHAPIYATSDTDLGTGIVGGYVINWALLGSRIGEESIRLMQGDMPLPEVSTRWRQWMFDWRQVQRWHVDIQEMPPGSVILFRSPTFWELHRWQVLTVSAVVLLEFVLILILLRYRYRQQRTEKKLRDLAGELMEIQQEDRSKISCDLQEHTERDLVTVTTGLERMLDSGKVEAKHLRLLQETRAVSVRALEEIRRIVFLLDPPALDGKGLVSSLQSYLGGLSKHTSANILPEFGEVGVLPRKLEEILFRVAQESLAKVIHNSHADTVVIRLEKKSGYIHLAVEDNGFGMHVEEDWTQKRMIVAGASISGMQELVSQLGGDFQVQSSSTGTSIRVTMPVGSE